eukprot:505434-Prorocentrum_lima.AAC.1
MAYLIKGKSAKEVVDKVKDLTRRMIDGTEELDLKLNLGKGKSAVIWKLKGHGRKPRRVWSSLRVMLGLGLSLIHISEPTRLDVI